MRLRVKIEDEIDPLFALSCVDAVIGKGRISKNNTQYCYVTTFRNGVVVCASRTRKGTDTFFVCKPIANAWRDEIDAAVKKEREACALTCERRAESIPEGIGSNVARQCRLDILARGK